MRYVKLLGKKVTNMRLKSQKEKVIILGKISKVVVHNSVIKLQIICQIMTFYYFCSNQIFIPF